MTQDTIVKIFTGKHIDLSKIVAISDAYFINHTENGNYGVGFDIECQLLDKPIHYERELTKDEESESTLDTERYGMFAKQAVYVKMLDGTKDEPNRYHSGQPEGEILAVHNLQKQVDEVIQQWKASKSDPFDQLMDRRQGTDGFMSGQQLSDKAKHILEEHRDDIQKFLDEKE